LKTTFKKFGKRALIGGLAFILIASGVNAIVLSKGKHRTVFRITDVSECETGLIMGTEPFRPDGTTNLHFLSRVTAAVELYSNGKVKRLLVSGNPRNREFDEVSEIREALLARGIPNNAIILDSGGIRTWETARRAREIYHLRKVIVITDDFHAARAVLSCEHFGIDSVAFCPGQDPVNIWFFRYRIREFFARIKMVIDMMFNR
jgi:SanA protein